MVIYTEKNDITTKIEFTEFDDEIGWSLLGGNRVYLATVTEFSIARGVISVRIKVVNADGSEYKLPYYRNHWNGFTATADARRTKYDD
jgi:hypothetical protein